MTLEDCRKVIDAIDTEIVALLNRRAHLSQRIGLMKAVTGLPIIDESREEMVLRRIVRENDGDIDDAVLTSIYRDVLAESRRIQGAVAGDTVERELHT